MATGSVVEFDDIQGLARFGHGHMDAACFLLLEVADSVAAGEWLRAAPVTTSAAADPKPDRALQVALTAQGLKALAVPDSVIADFSDEFVSGMAGDANRSRRLGDVGASSPDRWQWGGEPCGGPHVLLMLYACGDHHASWGEALKADTFARAFRIRRMLTTASRGALEPFGFVDGISQPRIDWEGEMSTDLHERDRYANLLVAGEVLLGYPNEYGLYTGRPLLDPDEHSGASELPAAEEAPGRRDLGRNGTYLVVRQLGQDVPGFWRFVDQAAGSDAGERERLAANMVGRQRDGTPLATTGNVQIPGTDPDKPDRPANQFTFDDDPNGYQCPIGAHVRRANPRTGDFPPGVNGTISRLVRTLGFGQRHPHDDLVASTRFHRLLRRGRPYGPALTPEESLELEVPNAERGLHFVCLGANISRQFEFVQNAWVMSSKFAGLPTEADPLLGSREPLPSGQATNRFSIPRQEGAVQRLEGLPRFITVHGGGYFFMPGIRALHYIAGLASGQDS